MTYSLIVNNVGTNGVLCESFEFLNLIHRFPLVAWPRAIHTKYELLHKPFTTTIRPTNRHVHTIRPLRTRESTRTICRRLNRRNWCSGPAAAPLGWLKSNHVTSVAYYSIYIVIIVIRYLCGSAAQSSE